MPVNNPPGTTPRVLEELDVPGRTGPVSQTPLVWGLGEAAVKGNFPKQGLLCRAGPWPIMGEGDSLVISLNSQSVFNTTVDADEVDKTLSMFVPAARFNEGSSTLKYAVTRRNDTTPEPSEIMQVLVKLTRPGGHDSDEGPGHSKLKMTIPREIIEGGIDKDNIAAGVPITIGPSDDGPEPYPDAAAGDVIQVTWGGVFVLYGPLTQDQADGKVPLVVHIGEATIREAEDSDSGGLAVAFEVYDIVDNRSEDWSYEQRVVVAVDATRLDAPICKQALNNVLDVDKLGDADATAQVVAMDGSRFKVGDIPILRLKGTPVEGAPINIEVRGQPLASVPSIPEIAIPNAALRQLAKTQIALSFRLQKADGTADLPSKTQFISVIGEIQRLLAPRALDASQGALDPDLAQARIEIPFDKSFVAGQAIKLFWLGTRSDLSTYLPDLLLRPITGGDISAGVPLLINVPGLHLKQIEGGTLELYYQLLSDDAVQGTMNRVNATHAIRESIHAELLNVGEPKKELPEPTVDGVVDGVLPPDTAGTTLTVKYLNTVKDDEVFCVWLGSKTGRYEDSVKLSSFTAGQPVPFPIKAELIKDNEGGTVEASYFIKWADRRPTSYSDENTFSVDVELDLKALKIKEAPDDKNLLPNAAKDTLTAVVDYVGMALQDKIIVTWTGAPGTPAGGSHTAPEKTVTVLGPQEIPLANSVVAFNLNKQVSVSYTAQRGSGKLQPSPALPLAVQALILDLSNVPKILQAANNGDGTTLDLSAIATAGTIHAPNWPLIALYQYVWLWFKGTLSPGDTPYEVLLWKAPNARVNQAWVDKAYVHPLAATELNKLKQLKHGSTFSIEFKAALGQSQNEADAVPFPTRTYTVIAIEDIKPKITSVKGSPSGVDIPQNGLTVETAVILTGTATNGQNVKILDGNTDKGDATANPVTGIWTKTVSGLGITLHSLTAKALYVSGQVSDPWPLTVTPVVVHTIDKVLDNKGEEIPKNGATVSPTVTVSGKASKGQSVEVWEGTGVTAVVLGTAIADVTTGIWEETFPLKPGPRRLVAKRLYTGAPEWSNDWLLTVVADEPPTLTSVKGLPSNLEILNGGITTETSVTLTGTAAKGQKVDVLLGTVSKGQPVANPTTGIWTLTLAGLTAVLHSFTAKALYGTGASSTARTFTVTAATAPTITSVKGLPSNLEILNAGITTETSAILTGIAAKGQKVDVLLGTVSKGQPVADLVTGIWTLTLAGLTAALHSFTAKALYAPGASSAARTFTVTPVVVHTIDKVLDNKGEEILPGGTTVSPTVTVSGKASKGQSVEVWEGTGTTAVVLGTAIADVTTGIWEETFPLALGPRRLVAKRLYTGAPEWSNDRLLTVVALVNPTIDTIKDPAGTLIQEGATTVSTTLNMEGKASEGQRIEMLEGTGAGAVSKGTAIADPKTGIWKMSVTVAVGPRRFAAKSLYHSSDTYSNVRTLTVSPPKPRIVEAWVRPYNGTPRKISSGVTLNSSIGESTVDFIFADDLPAEYKYAYGYNFTNGKFLLRYKGAPPVFTVHHNYSHELITYVFAVAVTDTTPHPVPELDDQRFVINWIE